MFCKIRSLGIRGVTGYEVTAECDLSGGLPNFDIVGLPDAAVKEARDRVRAAVKNCGFTFPVSRITVNLAPADRKKGGTVYDLPILVGILAAGGQLSAPPPNAAFVGELSLSGQLRPVAGMLPMALACLLYTSLGLILSGCPGGGHLELLKRGGAQIDGLVVQIHHAH